MKLDRIFKVGDEVMWTHVSIGKKQLNMSRREGVIEEINDYFALVLKSGGRREKIECNRLRFPNETSQITEFVEIMREG